MTPKVVITAANRSPSEEVLNLFRNAGMEVEYKPVRTTEQLIEAGRDADALLVGHNPHTTREVMETCSRVKAISRNGVGVDSVDLKAATELGIAVCNTPGVNSSEVADHAMALILTINRRILELSELAQSKQWSANTGIAGPYWNKLRRIAGSTVGIYGFGNIGRALALTVRGFGVHRVLAHDNYVPDNLADQFGVELVDFDTLIKESDYISLHAPETPETRHAFSTATFAKMKSNAVLVNCSRGGLVDEKALVKALDDKQIRAAGLDVFETEPVPADSPLLGRTDLVITPHLAGGSDYTGREGSRRWAESVVFVLQGKRPHGIANPKVSLAIDAILEAGGERWKGFPPPGF